MKTMLTAFIVIVMSAMAVLPLFAVMYLGNERSKVGPIVLAAAMVGGALLGTTLIDTA